MSVTSGGPDMAVDVGLAGAGIPVGVGRLNGTVAVGESKCAVGVGFVGGRVGCASIGASVAGGSRVGCRLPGFESPAPEVGPSVGTGVGVTWVSGVGWSTGVVGTGPAVSAQLMANAAIAIRPKLKASRLRCRDIEF